MTDITLRQVKGAPLTYDEIDANFANLKETADLAYDAVAAVGGKANASALGTDADATDMGTPVSSVYTPNGTAKDWFEEAGAAIEGKADAAFSHSDSYDANTISKAMQQYVSVKDAPFNAAGDGVTDDTAAWAAFQAATGIKFVPAGDYLVSGRTLTFNNGVVGNGDYDYVNYAHAELTTDGGNKLKDSLLVHHRYIDNGQESLYSGPAIVTQTHINLEVPDTETSFTDFKQFYGATHELVLDGYYDFDDDGNHNYSTGCFSNRNRMAGMMGSTALCAYSYDAKESENPNITTMGATKTGTMYLQTTRRARYASGGYTLAFEVYSLNHSDDADTDIPYTNNDTGSFTSFDASVKLSAGGAGNPITHAVMITGLGSKHGFYNGISIGGSSFRINNNTQGPAGTVSINLATQRAATGFSDNGIRYGTNNRHHYYAREAAKIQTSEYRVMNASGSSGVSIEAASSGTPVLLLKTGATTAFDGGSVTEVFRIEGVTSNTTLTSAAGEIRLKPNGGGSTVGYTANEVRFAPYTVSDGVPHLGAADRRWNTLYATNATINTSDERKKTPLLLFSDAILDAWGEVQYGQFQMLDAVAIKGDGARWHTGVIAQRVVEAFERHGLDAHAYGLLCYDEWEAKPEEVTIHRVKVKEPVYEQVEFKPAGRYVNRVVIEDAVYEKILVREEYVDEETGKTVPAKYRNGALLQDAVFEEQEYEIPAEYEDGELLEEAVYEETVTVIPAQEAGNVYGIRYEEALCLEAAYSRRELQREREARIALEARIAILEERLAA